MPDRRALSIIEQAEGRKLCEEALREIELGHTDFEAELVRIKQQKSSCKQKGDAKVWKHWTIAERLLKRAKAEAKEQSEAPNNDSLAL